MILTVEQRVRVTIGELFLQNIALQAENEALKAQLAEKNASTQEPAPAA